MSWSFHRVTLNRSLHNDRWVVPISAFDCFTNTARYESLDNHINKANRQEENELYNHDHKKFETTILYNDHSNNLDVAGGGVVGSGPDDRCDCSDRIPSHITIVDNNNIKTASTTIIIIVVVFIVIGRGINVKNSFS